MAPDAAHRPSGHAAELRDQVICVGLKANSRDDLDWAEIYQRVVFKDGVPWVVITVGRPVGEER